MTFSGESARRNGIPQVESGGFPGALSMTDPVGIMSRLIAEIDRSERAAFGRRFASRFNAPPKTMRLLALILLRSMQLDEGTLVEGARTKSQDHLFAISGRQRISQTKL
jgi:hypothetical protein